MSPSVSKETPQPLLHQSCNNRTTKHTRPHALSRVRPIGILLAHSASSTDNVARAIGWRPLSCMRGPDLKSSNFCQMRPWLALPAALLLAAAAGATDVRSAEVVKLPGNEVAMFDGVAIDRLDMLACTTTECHPIPFQVDERDPSGRWVLDQGP